MSSELFLLDPCGQIRTALSASSVTASVHEHVRVDTFVREARLATSPCVAMIDVTGLRDDEIESLRAACFPDLFLLIVSVERVGAGHEWLAWGAHDFVVLPDREAEITTRISRWLTHGEQLVDPKNQGEAQHAFLRRLAHELKNPLNAISGYAELLLMEETLDSQAKVDVGRILRNAALLQSTIESAVARASDEEESEDSPHEPQLESERS